MSYVLGLDTSYAQGTDINYQAVKDAGYQFVLQRMSYSYPGQPSKFDTTATQNYEGFQKVGMVVGGYHKIGWTDPIAEADFFLSAMSPLAENDLLAHDMEPSSDVPIPPNWSEFEQAYVQRIHDKTGVWSIRYENISMNNSMVKQGVVTNCPSWVAAPSYSWDAGVPVSTPVIIQQGPAINVPGIPANVCDTDAFFGQGTSDELLVELKKLAYHAPVNSPAPAVPESPVPPVIAQPAPGTIVEPQTPVQPPTNGTAIDVVVNPPKSKPVPAPVEPIVNKSELNKAEGFVMKLGKYNKFWIGLAGAILTYLSLHYGSSTIVQDAVLIATTLGIYTIPNTPIAPAK